MVVIPDQITQVLVLSGLVMAWFYGHGAPLALCTTASAVLAWYRYQRRAILAHPELLPGVHEPTTRSVVRDVDDLFDRNTLERFGAAPEPPSLDWQAFAEFLFPSGLERRV